MSQSLTQIQSKLDSLKGQMKEGAYLEMCNLMKNMYETQQDEKNMYNVTMVIPKITKNIDEDSIDDFDIHIMSKTIIMQLTKTKYEEIKNLIDERICKCYTVDTGDGIGLKIPFSDECINELFYNDDNGNGCVLRVANKAYCIINISPV
jgi:hypothetical protein